MNTLNHQNKFMKVRVIFIVFSVVFLSISCREQKDDLDIIKEYNPENKYFKANMVTIHYIIETSPIAKLDTLFTMLIEQNGLPVSARGCPDGVYTGSSPYDAFDYEHTVKIEIKDEKIISVDYDEIKKSGTGKKEDKKYCEEMKVTGTTPAIAYPEMERQLLEEQNMMDVDAVTGATYSLYRFRYALTVALMKAKLIQ